MVSHPFICDKGAPYVGTQSQIGGHRKGHRLLIGDRLQALNGRSDISDEARAAIDRALKATGYQRRGQKTAGQRYIEVVFQDLDTIWALEVLRGVLRETRHSPDISVITTESGTRQHPDDDWITGMLRRKPFGVIFIFANLTKGKKADCKTTASPTSSSTPQASHRTTTSPCRRTTGPAACSRHVTCSRLGTRASASSPAPKR